MVRGDMARTNAKRRSPRARPQRVLPAESPASRRVSWLVASGVGGVALLAYLLTAARDLIPGDSAEFVTVALTGGVAHAPGYPLLSLIGVLFGQLPLDPQPFRINLIAVLCHAATVSLVFLTAERLTRSVLASAAAALLLAFGRLFWTWSLVAETFPLNDLLAAAVVYLLVLWRERPGSRALLLGAGAAFGLGLANQQTITLLIPAIAYLLYSERAAFRDRSLLPLAATAAVAGLLIPYSYIAVAAGRHELLNWGGIASPGDLARQALRLDYGTAQLIPTRDYQGGSGVDRMTEFVKNATPALAVLAIAGAVAAYGRARWYFWVAVLAFVFTAPVFLVYANANVAVPTARFILARFYLLPQVVVAPLAAFGLVFLVETLRRRLADPPRRLQDMVVGAAFALVALELVFTFGAVDRSGDRVARQFAEDILASTAPDAILIADADHVILPLAYLKAVEHRRPDVILVIFPLLPLDWYQRELRLRHPELQVPLARYGEPDGLKILLQANIGRPAAFTSEVQGQSFGGLYGLYGKGLTLPVIGPDANLDLGALAETNEKLLESYRTPNLRSIDRESFERFILTWYALVPYRVGSQFEAAKQFSVARSWYERALAIDPDLGDALIGLRRIQDR